MVLLTNVATSGLNYQVKRKGGGSMTNGGGRIGNGGVQGRSTITHGGEQRGGGYGNPDLMSGSVGVKRLPITTREPVSPSLSTTSQEEGGIDNRKRPVQTREGRAKRRVIAKARTVSNQERSNELKNIDCKPPACPSKDARETKKERKRLQNRRSIEKCRLRELGRLKALNDEKDALEHDTQILRDALSAIRASGVLEIVAAVRACSEM